MIKLQVIGNLGRDCVVNNVSGRNVMNFSVAHSEKFKDGQGNLQERTIWVDCAYWSDRTAIAPYLKKGTTVFVEGQPSVEMYTTNQGTQGVKMRLNVRDIQLVGGRSSDNQNQNNNSSDNQSAPSSAPSNQNDNAMSNQMNSPAGMPNGGDAGDLPF
jgi:single-strand DNA-binding protein